MIINKKMQTPVIDKISCIFKCSFVKGTTSEKNDRNGEKYIAEDTLNPEVKTLLENNAKYIVTAKIDGTCCIIKNGELLKRRDIKPGKSAPESWIQTGLDNGRHMIGFMKLEKGDKWHLDAHYKNDDGTYDLSKIRILHNDNGKMTYKYENIANLNEMSVELIGPKFQNNPHNVTHHCIVIHGSIVIDDFPNFMIDTIKEWMVTNPKGNYIEGIVIHFENGAKYKLHRHHLDMKWKKSDCSLENFPY